METNQSQYEKMCEVYERYNKGDLVPVVRCKECKYGEHWYRDKARCFLWNDDGIGVFEDGYCNYGERRKEKGEKINDCLHRTCRDM